MTRSRWAVSILLGLAACGDDVQGSSEEVCGDGRVGITREACDDGDLQDGDGCSARCAVEVGFGCGGAPSTCRPTCGDGLRVEGEACDDGNRDDADGCSSSCVIRRGWTCEQATPDVCRAICGDSSLLGAEACDDGNVGAGDGCSPACAIEDGFACEGEPSSCLGLCGDGHLVRGESCDDGNARAGDGCSPECVDLAQWTPLPGGGAPSPRQLIDGVWTGVEMVVWGGRDGDRIFGDGARYDPTSDTWTPLSTRGAPSRRRAHGAVWTGTEMIVFGGADTGIQTDGARYDPVADEWRPMASSAAAANYYFDPRNFFAQAWTGERLIIFGGLDTSSYDRDFGDGAIRDPALDAWSPMDLGVALPRRTHAAAVSTGEDMIIWGGLLGADSGSLADGARFEVASETWHILPELDAPRARMAASAVWTGSEMIVAALGRGCPIASLPRSGAVDRRADDRVERSRLRRRRPGGRRSVRPRARCLDPHRSDGARRRSSLARARVDGPRVYCLGWGRTQR